MAGERPEAGGVRHRGGGCSGTGKQEGRYANYFKVGHNAHEFVVDCGQFYAGSESPRVHTRLITSPAYAKALRDTLTEALERYERSFGRVPHMEGVPVWPKGLKPLHE